MKKLHWLFMAICLAVMPALQSCDNADGYSVGDFTPPLWATVRITGTSFYLDSDRWGTLWPINTNLGWYEPADGQRVITSFNPIYDNFEGYDHAVKILRMQEVLTKNIDTLDGESEDDFGNDPLLIYKSDMGISGGYLNIIFIQNLPAKTKHRISLVRAQEDAETYAEDGYIHLQLRYNTYDDVTGNRYPGAVSFNLSSLDMTSAKGIKLKMNSEVNKEVELTFDLKDFSNNLDKSTEDFSKMQLK